MMIACFVRNEVEAGDRHLILVIGARPNKYLRFAINRGRCGDRPSDGLWRILFLWIGKIKEWIVTMLPIGTFESIDEQKGNQHD